MQYLKLLTGIALLIGTTTQAAEVYRSTDEHGNTVYSGQPPGEQEDTRETIVLPPGPSATERERALQRAREQKQIADSLERKRTKKQQNERNELESLRNAVKQAEAELIKAKEVGPGDRKGTAGGGSRFTQSYISRVETAEKKLEEAKEALKKKRKP